MEANKKIPVVNRKGEIEFVDKQKKVKKDDTSVYKYLNIGFYLATPLVGGVFLGLFLDNWLKTKPLLTIILIVLGAIGTMYNLIKLTQDAEH